MDRVKADILIIVIVGISIESLFAGNFFYAQGQRNASTDRIKSDLVVRGFTIVEHASMNSPSIEVLLDSEASLIQKATELNTSTIYQTYNGLWVFNESLTIGYCYSP